MVKELPTVLLSKISAQLTFLLQVASERLLQRFDDVPNTGQGCAEKSEQLLLYRSKLQVNELGARAFDAVRCVNER